ncbi:MAG TPA: hypothetical protein VFI11_09245, partial [Anaerolineales bacterium]|nr:hypothetical protein [Anaerolineales bacterium]
KAPWYFVGLQELVSYSAVWGGVIVPVAILGLSFLLPYLDRDPRGIGTWFSRHRRTVVWIGVAIAAAWLVLTLVGQFARGPNWQLIWPGQPWMMAH